MSPPLRHGCQLAWSRPLWVGVALGLAFVSSCDSTPTEPGKRDSEAIRADAEERVAPPPATRTVTFETIPPEAAVFVDGEQLTGDPRQIEGNDATRVYRVVASALGYQSQSMDMTLARDAVRIVLEAEAPIPIPPTGNRNKRRSRRAGASPAKPAVERSPPSPPPEASKPPQPQPGDDLSAGNKKRPASDIDVDVEWVP